MNLASRLESLNKEVGSELIVSDAVREAAGTPLAKRFRWDPSLSAVTRSGSRFGNSPKSVGSSLALTRAPPREAPRKARRAVAPRQRWRPGDFGGRRGQVGAGSLVRWLARRRPLVDRRNGKMRPSRHCARNGHPSGAIAAHSRMDLASCDPGADASKATDVSGIGMAGVVAEKCKSAYFPTSSEPRISPAPQRVAEPCVTLHSQSSTPALPAIVAAPDNICNGPDRPAILSRLDETGTSPVSSRSAAAPPGTIPSSMTRPVESPRRRKRAQLPASRGPRRSTPSAALRSVAALAAVEKASSARSTTSESLA